MPEPRLAGGRRVLLPAPILTGSFLMFRRTHHGRFYNDIHAFATGSSDVTQLPMEDGDFWREVFEYPVDVEGRRNPAVTMGIERLLHDRLDLTAMEVRRFTAIQVLDGGEPPARRQA